MENNNSRNINETFRILEQKIQKKEEEKLIIGGDFNTRTERKGGPIKDGFDDIHRRNSKDVMINKEGKEMLKALKKKAWARINGSMGEENETWTYLGESRASVIDYVLANRAICNGRDYGV